MDSLTPMDVDAVKLLVEEEEPVSKNVMDVVENMDELPSYASGSMKSKRSAQRKPRKRV